MSSSMRWRSRLDSYKFNLLHCKQTFILAAEKRSVGSAYH